MKTPAKQKTKAGRKKQIAPEPTNGEPAVQDETPDEVKHLWGDPTDPEFRAIEPETKRVMAGINWLTKKAHGGDKIAYRRLVALVSHGATAVRALTTVALETTREIARESTCWPVNITDSKDLPENLDALRKCLQIGANYPLGFNLRVPLNYKSKTRCRELVIYCILIIQASRAFETKKKDTIYFINLTRKLDDQLAAAAALKSKPENLTVNFVIPNGESAPQLMTAEEFIEKSGGLENSAHAARALANSLHREIEPLSKTAHRHLKSLRKLLNLENIEATHATKIFDVLREASALPEPSPVSKEQWFSTIRLLLLALTKDAPEENNVLKEIGKYRADSYFRRERSGADVFKAKSRAEKTGSAAKTIAANIRDGIFTKVKQQLASLLKKTPV